MRTLKRPMFKKGGSANEGIMTGLVDRRGYAKSNAADLFRSIGSGRGVHSGIAPGDVPEYELPKRFEWSEWMMAETQNVTLPSGKEIKVRGAQEVNKPIELPEMIKTPPGGGDLAMKYKKPKGDLSGTNRIAMQLLASEKKDKLSDKAKRYAKLLSPNAMKRATTDALIAASEAGQTSTGNTFQDLTNMLTAAAKGSGGARDTLDKANLLAIQEEIQTNIAKATYKPNATESLIALGKSSDPEDQKLFTVLSKGKDADANMIISLAGNYTGPNAVKKARGDLFQIKANSANAETYGGTLPLDRKGEIADFGKMENGKEYYNFLDGNFYKLDEKSEPEVIKKPGYLK